MVESILQSLDLNQIIIALVSMLGIGFGIKIYSFKQNQKSGNNSKNYQAKGDINIGTKND